MGPWECLHSPFSAMFGAPKRGANFLKSFKIDTTEENRNRSHLRNLIFLWTIYHHLRGLWYSCFLKRTSSEISKKHSNKTSISTHQHTSTISICPIFLSTEASGSTISKETMAPPWPASAKVYMSWWPLFRIASATCPRLGDGWKMLGLEGTAIGSLYWHSHSYWKWPLK